MDEHKKKLTAIKTIAECLTVSNKNKAKSILEKEYAFTVAVNEKRKRVYTVKQKMKLFIKDGFIDRYTGEKLVNPGMLKVISAIFPQEFPYQPHWKVTETHPAYWEFVPTIDHIIPIANGGIDAEENWATTSMLNNSIKSNWTLEQLKWHLFPPGNMNDWDGLTDNFVRIVDNDPTLNNDSYIRQWYEASKTYLKS